MWNDGGCAGRIWRRIEARDVDPGGEGDSERLPLMRRKAARASSECGCKIKDTTQKKENAGGNDDDEGGVNRGGEGGEVADEEAGGRAVVREQNLGREEETGSACLAGRGRGPGRRCRFGRA